VQRGTTGKSSQGWLPLECESDLGVYNLSTETPAETMELMERIVAPSNVRAVYRKQLFRELTAWIKRRLCAYVWTQWRRGGYRELRKRGVSRDLAWNTCKSHHGPWRLSRSPALAFALTTGYFVDLGLPLLHVNV